MNKLFFALIFIFVASGASARNLCDKNIEKNVLESNVDSVGKYNALRQMGCSNSFMEEYERQRAAQEKAQLKILNDRKEEERVAAQIRKENAERARIESQIAAEKEAAEREEFEQQMANKCGEYPLDVKIGMPEKLLKMGCAGSATLALEQAGGVRVYHLAYETVTVKGGKVFLRLVR